jgi:homocitrate synthase
MSISIPEVNDIVYHSAQLHIIAFSLLSYLTHVLEPSLTSSLDEFGVEYIELTSPAASPESRAHCEAICKLGLKRTKILTHIRCHMDDARIAVETGVDGVDVVIGTSSFLREHSHGKDMTWITKT